MNIVLIGKPGSGKGTISDRLKSFGFAQLSTGDLLRQEINTGSELGKEIQNLLAHGKFASDEIIFNIVDNFTHGQSNVLFDGYPRNIKQAHEAEKLIDKVIFLETDDNLIMERLSNRFLHAPSGRSYNLKTMPPKNAGVDDVTGEPLTQRDDDKPEVIKKRLAIFQEITMPVYDYYKTIKPTLVVDSAIDLDEQLNQIKEFLGLQKKFKP